MTTPREHVARLERVKNAEFSRLGLLRLDKNENPSGLPHSFIRQALSALTSAAVSSYPEVYPLYDRLSAVLGLPRDRLYVSAGSDAAIKAVFEVFVNPGDKVAVLDPSYAMYEVYAGLFQAKLVRVPFLANLVPDDEALERAVRSPVRLFCLANPNSPTGTVLHPDRLESLLETARDEGVTVLVDEAYHGFHPFSSIGLVERFPNLVVTRTFSKFHGLASARLGFAAACDDTAALLAKVRPMYEVNAYAVAMGMAILDRPDLTRRMLRAFQRGRKRLLDSLETMGLSWLESHANFLLIDLESRDRALAVQSALREKGILVGAGFSHPAMAPCLRVTIGNTKCMDIFVAALREAISNPQPQPAQ